MATASRKLFCRQASVGALRQAYCTFDESDEVSAKYSRHSSRTLRGLRVRLEQLYNCCPARPEGCQSCLILYAGLPFPERSYPTFLLSTLELSQAAILPPTRPS